MNPDQDAMRQYLLSLGADDPAVMQAIVASGLFNEQMALSGQDYGTGQGMMQTPGAEGMRVGGTYVAANPLEHASVAMSRIMGAQQMKGARTKQDEFMKQLNDAKVRMLNAQGAPRQQPAGVPTGPGGWGVLEPMPGANPFEVL